MTGDSRLNAITGVGPSVSVRIGVPQSDYNTDRNIIGSLPSWATRIRPLDPYRLRSSVRQRVRGTIHFPEHFTFSEPYFPRVDLLHFFNRVSRAAVPWMCTFETSLPRWGKVPSEVAAAGMRLLLSPACRRLFAMSDSALSIATMDWRRALGDSATDDLLSKTEVLLPPQRIIGSPNRPDPRNRTEFTFVGGDLYRKGGLEFLEALVRLHSRGVRDWHATIVGRLDSFGDYASGTTAADRGRAMALLGALGDNVTHLARAGNAKVMDLLKASHFFVFPTLADTFGYSVLEAQACGAVVISTNVRAMPEVNRDEWGIVIQLPLDERRECHSQGNIRQVRSTLAGQLEHALSVAIEMPERQRAAMAERATANLATRHSPERHVEIMASRYEHALSR